MSDDNVDNQVDGQAGDPQDDADKIASSRRSLLKKAAFAPIIAGAVWAAPKVEHLSLVPDVAAAQSGATPNGPYTIPINGDGFPVTTTAGPLTLGTSQGGPDPTHPSMMDMLFNTPGGPCTIANINAVNAIVPGFGDPIEVAAPISTQASGHADLGFINDQPYNLGNVTFDLLCT